MKKQIILIGIMFALAAAQVYATTYYISPAGSDSNNGRSEPAPFKTFNKAFTTMTGGDELIVLDGNYSIAAGTGIIHSPANLADPNSAQPPYGVNANQQTYVHAKNLGKVWVTGGLFLGCNTACSPNKAKYIIIEGITFQGDPSAPYTSAGGLYNTDHVTIRKCGFVDTSNGGGTVFGIGTNDGGLTIINTNDLIEDSWVWGQNRLIAGTYNSYNIVWRRVIIRGDGCNGVDCQGSGNPNVGITTYSSSNVSLQNVIVMDRVLGLGSPYGDFACAQHAGSGDRWGGNEWLGTLSLKSPDGAYYCEPDAVWTTPAGTFKDCVGWDSQDGMDVARSGQYIIQNCVMKMIGGSGDAFRVAPELAGTGGSIQNIIALGNGRYAINSAYPWNYSDVFGTWSQGNYNQNTCTSGCKTTNPLSDGATPSIKYITRIETGSALKAAGSGGADIGANIVNQYGITGTMWGDTNFDILSATSLWPWSNEAIIKQQMCDATYLASVNRTGANAPGLCSSGKSLSRYIWEYLGNTCPTGMCAASLDTTPPSVSITAPANNTALNNGIIQINASATDDVAVANVTFIVNGTIIGTDTTTPYTTNWNASNVADGTKVNITAKATDTSNNTANTTITITITIPTATYYLSTTGNDANSGTSALPWATFAKAWTVLQPGDTLIVKNGTYNQDASPPGEKAGTAANRITIRAEDVGGAIITSTIDLRGNSYLSFSGMKIVHPTSAVYIVSNGVGRPSHHLVFRNLSFNCNQAPTIISDGACFALGDGAHDILLEDSWGWGSPRYTVLCYGGPGGNPPNLGCDNNTFRRVVLRMGPGSSSTDSPQAGIAMYYASNNTIENVIVTDSVPNSDSSNAAFYLTGHAPPPEASDNKFYGDIALKSTGFGWYFDVPGAVGSRNEVKNSVIWGSDYGIALDTDVPANCDSNIFEHVTVKSGSDGIGNYYCQNISVKSSIFFNNSGYGMSQSQYGGSMPVHNWNLVFGNLGGNYNGITTGANDQSVNPRLSYITRIESGTPCSGGGEEGTDCGSNILYRYQNGVLTGNSLWPWPNEERIKADMCTGTDATRGFCASSSLTNYIWEYLGNSCPAGICATSSDTIPPVISNGQPNGTLTAGATSTTLSVTTDEAATCRYSASPGTAYSNMTSSFTDAGTNHSTTINVQNGTSYSYYARCNDTSGNVNTQDYSVSFNTAFATPDIVNNASFEPGDLPNQWDGFTSWSPPNLPTDVTLDTAHACVGSYAVKHVLPVNSGSDLSAQFVRQLPRGYDRLWSRFYFYLDAAMDGTHKFHLFFDPGFNTQLGGLGIQYGYINFSPLGYTAGGNSSEWDGQGYRLIPLSNLVGGWHSIEIDYWRNGDTGGNIITTGTGEPSIAIWIDGTQLTSGIGNPPTSSHGNGYWKNNRIYVGARTISAQFGIAEWSGVLNGMPANTIPANLWLDQISISSLGRIGPGSCGNSTGLSPPSQRPGDLNDDGKVNFLDLLVVISDFRHSGASITNTRADINGEGTVNLFDFVLLAKNWGRTY